jgi:uncharacterized small protein (DUF1192 family)
MKLTREELMQCLSERPGCCATVRDAATTEITFLRSEVDRLNKIIGVMHDDINQLHAQSDAAIEMVRVFSSQNRQFDLDDYRAACANAVASKCRNWRSVHMTKLGDVFESAAEEIERLVAELAQKQTPPQECDYDYEY